MSAWRSIPKKILSNSTQHDESVEWMTNKTLAGVECATAKTGADPELNLGGGQKSL